MPCRGLKQTNVIDGDHGVSLDCEVRKTDPGRKHSLVVPYARTHTCTCARTVEAIEQDTVT